MRLLLDGGATFLLMLCLAYWWLGNLTHELAGTAFFVLLARHFVNNQYWWRGLRNGRYDLRRWIGLILTICLLISMATLLATSFAISRSLFAWLPLPESYTISEIHMFAAYWAMAIVGLHVGFNWPRVTMLLRNLGVQGPAWRWVGWITGLALAGQGLRSAALMGLWTRLRCDYSLVMWEFDSQALAFFGHWFAIVGLFAFAGYGFFLTLGRIRAFRAVGSRPSCNI